jgi:hypothetical protein
MWTDATFLDTVTTGAVAQQVVMRKLDESAKFDPIGNPLVPKIDFDQVLRSFGGLIMHRDVVARLRAFSRWDFSGKWAASDRSPERWKHESHEVIARNATFNLDVQLAALIAGGDFSQPDAPPGGDFLWSGMAREPRGISAVIDPAGPDPAEMRNESPIPYSPAAAQASAALLNSARAVRQAASVALDAGLAATIAATWTATRAELLARAQNAYPDRGYT